MKQNNKKATVFFKLFSFKIIMGLSITLFSISWFSSCLQEDKLLETNYVPVTLQTSAASLITYNSAKVDGTISAPQNRMLTRGVCWSTHEYPTLNDYKVNEQGGIGAFSFNMTGLHPGTIYYLRAFAINNGGDSEETRTAYGNQVVFTTVALSLPTLTTLAISGITSTTAISGGNIMDDGGAAITMRGVCWSTTENPTISNSKTTDYYGKGSFTSSIIGLTPGATYYIRAYATNSVGTSYGTQVSTTTTAVLPIITTTMVSSITATTAITGGNVTSDGGAVIAVRGVCWSTTQNPITTNTKTIDGIGSGSFLSSLTGLMPGTTYYIRAYATNSVGTAYGIQVTATTLATLPIITTTTVSTITASSAKSGGSITSDGGGVVIARGVCWSTSQNPTNANSKTIDGTGVGSFTSVLSGLSANTIYYLRAYATNSAGTTYGIQVNFTTSMAVLPTINTSDMSDITATTAMSGGNITSDGGATISTRGVCWSTSQNPTSVNSNTKDGAGVGVFTSNVTGLIANTTYYLRAYSNNSQGTSYGSEISFKTLSTGNDYGELNNAYNTPTIINATSTINASIGFNSDQVDWYKINVTSDGEFKLKITNTNTSSVANGYFGNTYVFKNPTSSYVAGISIISNGQSQTTSALNFSKGEVIYIQVSRYSDNWATYKMECSFIERSSVDLSEPNNSYSSSTIIDQTSNINASIGFNSDQVDWYKINVTSDGEFKLKITNTNTSSVANGYFGNTYVYKNPNSSYVAGISIMSNGQSQTTSALNFSKGEVIYIQVSRYSDNWASYKMECSFKLMNP